MNIPDMCIISPLVMLPGLFKSVQPQKAPTFPEDISWSQTSG